MIVHISVLVLQFSFFALDIYSQMPQNFAVELKIDNLTSKDKLMTCIPKPVCLSQAFFGHGECGLCHYKDCNFVSGL